MQYRAGIRDQKIRAADADVGRQELRPQSQARNARLLLDHGLVLLAELIGENLRHVEARHLQRRSYDVVRPDVGELDDVLAKIRLDRLQTVMLEPLVEIDLLG